MLSSLRSRVPSERRCTAANTGASAPLTPKGDLGAIRSLRVVSRQKVEQQWMPHLAYWTHSHLWCLLF